jgi:glycosyltransferase involved in cell wall biosynthesis
VAGQGWWEPHLQALAEELDIGKRVRFSGYVSEAEKHAILSWAWVSLLPSLKEGWGLTIVEAGSRGTPTVAFRTAGGVAEAIVDGRTGLLADDDSDFAAKLRQLLTEPEALRAMGEAAHLHATGFTWQAAGERFEAVVNTPRPQRVTPATPGQREP